MWYDLAVERRQRSLNGDGHLRRTSSSRCAFQPFARKLGAELAKAVFGLAAEGHEGVLGIDHRLDHAGITALSSKAVEPLVHGDRIGCDFLGSRIVPFPTADRVPFLSGRLKHFLNAFVPVTIHRRTRDATHLEDLASVGSS